MKPLEILKAVTSLKSKDIYELLYRHGIDVKYTPDAFFNTHSDARIITNSSGFTTIFLRLLPGENVKYEIYLLWHEFAHLILEGRSPEYRHHSMDTSEQEYERDADIFASLALIRNKSRIVTDDVEKLAEEIGAPYDVLDDVLFTLALDMEFMDYIYPSA